MVFQLTLRWSCDHVNEVSRLFRTNWFHSIRTNVFAPLDFWGWSLGLQVAAAATDWQKARYSWTNYKTMRCWLLGWSGLLHCKFGSLANVTESTECQIQLRCSMVFIINALIGQNLTSNSTSMYVFRHQYRKYSPALQSYGQFIIWQWPIWVFL